MYFYPKGNYLSIEEIQEQYEEDTYGFALPDDYKKKQDSIKVVRVLESRGTQGSDYIEGSLIVVQSHLIENFEYGGKKFSVIPINAIYGVLVDVGTK